MLPIRFAMSRRLFLAPLNGLIVLLLLEGVVPCRLKADPLPALGVDEFRMLIDSKRTPAPAPSAAGKTLAEYRRRLRRAAKDLPSLGEVSRVLLMSEWSTAALGFGDAVPPDRVLRVVRQEKDDAFAREVQKLIQDFPDLPGGVIGAIVDEIKRGVRLELLERLESRARFYLNQGQNADRIATANLIGDTVAIARRQDYFVLMEYRTGLIPKTPLSGRYLRQRLRSLSSNLEKLIAGSDSQVRVAAIRALSNLEIAPEELVPRLKPLLTSQEMDAPTRRAAAEALGHVLEVFTDQMDKTRPLPYLKALEKVLTAAADGLADSDPLVRRGSLESCQRAALVLEDLASDPLAATDRIVVFRPTMSVVLSVLPKLHASAADRIPELRVGACHVLETFALTVQRMRYREGPVPPPTIDRNLTPPQPNKEPSNSNKQGSLPAPRFPLKDAPVVTLERPIKLGEQPEARISRSSPTLVHSTAFRAVQLDQLPPPALVDDVGLQDTVKTMIENLKHADYRVRLASADTLETFGKLAAPAIPALVETLCDYNKFVRWSAARTLGRLSPLQADEVVPGLVRMLDDREDPSVRIAAAQALELYGEHARKAVPVLARVINRGDKTYIMAILRTIQGIGTDAAPALPNVAWVLRDRTQPPSVRIEAANTLGRFGSLATQQLPVLRDVMNNDPDVEVRNAASVAVLAVDRPEK